jgi:hypothetical protein
MVVIRVFDNHNYQMTTTDFDDIHQ